MNPSPCIPNCLICRLETCVRAEVCRRELADLVARVTAREQHPSSRLMVDIQSERLRDLDPDEYGAMLARAAAASVDVGLSDGSDRPATCADDVVSFDDRGNR